jgi:hypothetical protein
MTNPLKNFFRQPAIFVKLPSGGQFYPAGALDMPPNQEIPVYPMTAIDEITYRTPDALFNGSAIASVIRSCVPNIKDPWAMPSVDIDTLLVAIRIASNGHKMGISTACPSCSHEDEFDIDLRSILEKLKVADYSKTVKSGDLEIFFKPMNYKTVNDNSQAQFEEQRILQQIAANASQTAPDFNRLTDALRKITEITIDALSASIVNIRTPESMVNESAHISEFLHNCDRRLFNQIRDHVVKSKQESELEPLQLKCTECNFEYKQAFTLDMSNFFEVAS